MVKEFRECKICRTKKWFNKTSKEKLAKLDKKEKDKYEICLRCRMLLSHFKNENKSRELHAKIQVIEGKD